MATTQGLMHITLCLHCHYHPSSHPSSNQPTMPSSIVSSLATSQNRCQGALHSKYITFLLIIAIVVGSHLWMLLICYTLRLNLTGMI